MNSATYLGPGVEIEDDIVRLRRRKLEYGTCAARRAGPRRLRTLLVGKALQAGSDRWRWRR